MNKKITSEIAWGIILFVVIIAGLAIYFNGERNGKYEVAENFFEKEFPTDSPEKDRELVACTMEAKMCPDGSYVSRVAPNCEFTKCSEETKKKTCAEDEKICFDGTILMRSLPDCELAECKNIEVVEKNGWKTWVNNDDNYSISYPSEFWPQGGHNLKNYDMKDPRYDSGNPEGISIQIQKHSVSRMGFDTVSEYKKHLKIVSDVFADVATDVQLGEFISLYQYTKDGPGGAFANYMAFDSERGIFYNILVSEPGYKKNKELVEKILATFKII